MSAVQAGPIAFSHAAIVHAEISALVFAALGQ